MRRSSLDRDINGSLEDIRSTFICITNSPNGFIKSSEELTKGE